MGEIVAGNGMSVGIKAGPGPRLEEPTFKFEMRRKTWQMPLRSGTSGGRRETRRVWHPGSQRGECCMEGMASAVECVLPLHEVWWTERSERLSYLPLLRNRNTFSQVGST